MKLALFLAALVAPGAAMAANQVTLDSKIFVERSMKSADGKVQVVRAAPKPVFPGDSLLFQLSYHNDDGKPADHFTVTNPIPPSVVFASSDSGADYSVDGGKSWGPLASLHVRGANGTSRSAQASDVTHVRWVLARAIPAGGSGTLNFRGLVK